MPIICVIKTSLFFMLTSYLIIEILEIVILGHLHYLYLSFVNNKVITFYKNNFKVNFVD